MSKSTIIVPLVPAALGALLAVGATTAFSACDQRPDGTWMQCHHCQNTVVASAVGIAAALTASAFITNRPTRIALQVLAVLASIIVFFIPGGLCPMCMMRTMRCYTVFQPFVRIMTPLIAAGSIGAIVASAKKKPVDA